MPINKKQHCLHVITGLNDGGAESVLFRLCIADDECIHSVVSLTDGGKYKRLLENENIKVYSLEMGSIFSSIIALWKLYRLISALKPDLVQTWMYHADLIGGVIARLSGCKKVIWNIRHSELKRGFSKPSTILIARLSSALSSFIPSKIICCGDYAKSVHIGYGYDSTKIHVVKNGYDLRKFKPDVTSGLKVRKELGIQPEDFFIGMVGRFNEQKNHKGLLGALSFLKHRGVSFRCALVGKNIDYDNEALVNWIKTHDLSDCLILLGQRSDIPAIMNAFDVHVLSSSFGEGFPNVVAEAMASGTPCISTASGDAADIVGDSGWIVSVDDNEALAAALISAFNEYRYDSMAWSSRELKAASRINDNFSLDKMISDYHSVWFDV